VKPLHRDDPLDETRADIARRRLARLAASFDAELPPDVESAPQTRRRLDIPHARAVAAVAVAASVLLVWWLLSGRPKTSEPVAPLALASTSSAGSPTAAASGAPLIVDVVGKVRQPGIVTLPKGSRVYEVLVGLEAAEPGATAPGSPSGEPGPGGAKVNLNTATLEQLDTLPGVGPVTAQAILAWRESHGRFASVDDLLDVKGIGDATLAELRELVVV
jgi:competence protein ComEA